MIAEDYVSFEVAKFLKEKGFDNLCRSYWSDTHSLSFEHTKWFVSYDNDSVYLLRPTLQMTMKWIQETFNIVIIPNYEYEYDSTPWCYKIFKLGEHGKPERVAVKGVSYDKDDNPTEHIIGYRDYERSYKDYATKEEAIEEGIKYCLENLV